MANVEQKTMSEDEVLDWLAEIFQESRANITVETARQDIAAWDSLGVLTLMAELDEKFDLVLSDSDMQAMKKIGDVLSILRERGKLAA
jgi:acyl carrier protein